MTLDDLKEVDVDDTTSRYLIFFAFKPTTARVQKIAIAAPCAISLRAVLELISWQIPPTTCFL